MIGRNNVEIEGDAFHQKKAKIWSKKRNKRLTQLTVKRPTFIKMKFLMEPDNGKPNL